MSSNDSQKKKEKRKKESEKCLFCFDSRRDVIKYGRMYKLNDIYVHYYCLLLSSGLVQKGRDSEGIFGFLQKDILKEHKRGSKLKCSYCKEIGATIGCSLKTCKITFHLPCGQKNDALNQFFKSFDSFCVKHRPQQSLNPSDDYNDECPTCYSSIQFDEGIQVLVTPCCKKLVHRICLQKQALSAGYFFKCPLCNNGQQFKETMCEFGIFIPKQDASWEQEDNAFGELYQRHSRCDQQICLCPEGRNFRNNNSNWQILICDTCGSKGTHWTCVGQTNWLDVWVCDDCKSVDNRRMSNKIKNSSADHSIDENDIKIIPMICSPSASRNESTSQKPSIILSDDSDQTHEIDILEEIPVKRIKSSVVKKDVGIQCVLVKYEDLIDSEPLNEMEPIVFRDTTITLNSLYKNEENREIIDLEDSDDECVVLID